jgi:hypothetical protein
MVGPRREVAPYNPKKFAEFRDQKFELSHRELCDEADKIVKPLEEKAFEAGRTAGLAEAREESRTKLAEKIVATRTSKKPGTKVGGVEISSLIARSRELQTEARAKGMHLSNIDAIRAAYVEAGIPLS